MQTTDGFRLPKQLFLPLLCLLTLAASTFAFKHSVWARDKQDISLAVTVPSVCTEKTDCLKKFLAYTAQKNSNWSNLQTQPKAKSLFPLLRPLCSLMQDTPFCAMCPWGLQWWVRQLRKEKRNLMNGSFLVHSALLTHKFQRKQGKWSITY